jgi:hypothetical protein
VPRIFFSIQRGWKRQPLHKRLGSHVNTIYSDLQAFERYGPLYSNGKIMKNFPLFFRYYKKTSWVQLPALSSSKNSQRYVNYPKRTKTPNDPIQLPRNQQIITGGREELTMAGQAHL